MKKLIYLENFLENKEMEKLMSYLGNLKFKEHYIKIFKKQVKIPRLQLFLGEPNISYKYSKSTISAQLWHEPIKNLKNKIEKITKERYNCVLINKYRSGDDYVSFHQDNEKELKNEHIPSFSVGDSRTFILRPIKNSKERISCQLENNSLLIIPPEINKQYYHGIPKEKNKKLRYNLTFRYINPSAL